MRTGQGLRAKPKQGWTAGKDKRQKQAPESPNPTDKTLRLQSKLTCRIKNQEKKLMDKVIFFFNEIRK